MDMISIRRKLMAKMQSGGIDTSPRIAEYGAYWNRIYGSKTTYAGWCVTKWYNFAPTVQGVLDIVGYVGNDTAGITFQYNGVKTNDVRFQDWFYFAGKNSRKIGISDATLQLQQITFSIEIAEKNNAYAYIEQTGQILFAGRNTPYYGYTNIHDMPTGT